MRRAAGALFFVLAKLVCAAGAVFAQDSAPSERHLMALGIGLEWNMNVPERFADAFILAFDYNLPLRVADFAAGANVIRSSNFSGVDTLEATALFRWYFWRGSVGSSHTGWFAQANVGVSLFRAERGTPIGFVAEARAGYRKPLGERFFIEPYVRFGHPVMLGAGVLGGVRLPSRRWQEPANDWRVAEDIGGLPADVPLVETDITTALEARAEGVGALEDRAEAAYGQEALAEDAGALEDRAEAAYGQEALAEDAGALEDRAEAAYGQEALAEDAGALEDRAEAAYGQEALAEDAGALEDRAEAAYGQEARAEGADEPEVTHVTGTLLYPNNDDEAEAYSVYLWTISFLPDSVELSEIEIGIIHEIADFLRDMPDARVRLTGHAALAGTEDGRFTIAMERAGIIAAYLVELGAVSKSNIDIKSYGAYNPIADNYTQEGMAANRRVEIAILTGRNEGGRIFFPHINFLPDSAELFEEEDRRNIHEIAEFLRDIPYARIRIAGHAALAGTREGRFITALERAGAVAAYLIELGAVQGHNIIMASYGAYNPIADNNTQEGMAANRRVEITMLED